MSIRILSEALTFDDVTLIPRRTKYTSRFTSSINPETLLTPHISLGIPIISANMDTITDSKIANIMRRCEGLGIIHRFMQPEKQAEELAVCTDPVVACIGVGTGGRERLETLLKRAGKRCSIQAVLIDIAHGHADSMIQQIRWVANKYPNLDIIAGNVATPAGAQELFAAGASCVKVGIGPGSVCSTRINTGAGIPQLSAIVECAEVARDHKKTIIADGGIRSGGDIAKALAAGADAVMIGGLLAGSVDTPGETMKGPDGHRYKVYRGMASREAQEDWKGVATSIEGEMVWVRLKEPVEKIVDNLVSNLRSAMTYQNAGSIKELRERAMFRRQTQAGYIEGKPHKIY